MYLVWGISDISQLWGHGIFLFLWVCCYEYSSTPAYGSFRRVAQSRTEPQGLAALINGCQSARYSIINIIFTFFNIIFVTYFKRLTILLYRDVLILLLRDSKIS